MTSPNDHARGRFSVRPGYWFAPKSFGLGATPVTWQGWALVLGYVLAIIALMQWLPGGPVATGVVGVVITATVVYVSWLKTDGGWAWRWGSGK